MQNEALPFQRMSSFNHLQIFKLCGNAVKIKAKQPSNSLMQTCLMPSDMHRLLQNMKCCFFLADVLKHIELLSLFYWHLQLKRAFVFKVCLQMNSVNYVWQTVIEGVNCSSCRPEQDTFVLGSTLMMGAWKTGLLHPGFNWYLKLYSCLCPNSRAANVHLSISGHPWDCLMGKTRLPPTLHRLRFIIFLWKNLYGV